MDSKGKIRKAMLEGNISREEIERITEEVFTPKKYGYARVSSISQKDGNSLEDQRMKLVANGVSEEDIYFDVYTGTKMDRPRFNVLLSKVKTGDTIVVTKLDRFARTAGDGYDTVKSLMEKGVKVHLLDMGLIEDSDIGRLILHIMLAFAEFEREQILARMAAGKAIARRRPDYREGRPRKYDDERIRKVLELCDGGMSEREAATLTGISKSTIQRAKRTRQ